MTTRRLNAGFAIISLLGAPALAEDDVTVPDGPVEHADDGHARISDVVGTVFRRGPFDAEGEAARLNDLIREGDRLATEPGARVEIEFRGGTFVRLGERGALLVEQLLPDVRLELVQGSAFVSRGPDAIPVSLRVGDRRIEIEKGTVVRVDHEGGSGSNDALARWNDEREAAVRGSAQPSFVTAPYVGLHDLESNGQWVYVTGRWAWRPTVASGWRPYYDGDWAWVGPYGWTWIPTVRWGYVTHHYGRWQWTRDLGWVWVPGGRWAPAWVVWAGFDVYFGWAPVDEFGRPVIIYTTVSYYDPQVWCFARRSSFHTRHGRVAGDRRDRTRGDRMSGHAARVGATEILTLADRDIRSLRPSPQRDGVVARPASRVLFREAAARTIPARAMESAPLPGSESRTQANTRSEARAQPTPRLEQRSDVRVIGPPPPRPVSTRPQPIPRQVVRPAAPVDVPPQPHETARPESTTAKPPVRAETRTLPPRPGPVLPAAAPGPRPQPLPRSGESRQPGQANRPTHGAVPPLARPPGRKEAAGGR